jgi:hypothetical protein
LGFEALGVSALIQAFVMLVVCFLPSRRAALVIWPRAVFATLFAALRYALMNGFFAIERLLLR